jgi:hypothetical protein
VSERRASRQIRRELAGRAIDGKECDDRPVVIRVKRWREWGPNEAIPTVVPAAPITVAAEERWQSPRVLADEAERREVAIMRWAPWERRKRYARKRLYEGV